MHLEAEDTLEGGRCIRRRRRRRKQKQSSRWKGVVEGGSPYKILFQHIPPTIPRRHLYPPLLLVGRRFLSNLPSPLNLVETEPPEMPS